MCVPKKTLFHEFGWLKHSKIKSHVNNFSGVGIFKNEKDSRTTDTAKWSFLFEAFSCKNVKNYCKFPVMHGVLDLSVFQLAFNQLILSLSFSVLSIAIISYSRSNQLVMTHHTVVSCSPQDRTL